MRLWPRPPLAWLALLLALAAPAARAARPLPQDGRAPPSPSPAAAAAGPLPIDLTAANFSGAFESLPATAQVVLEFYAS